jgi:hypothetical protein
MKLFNGLKELLRAEDCGRVGFMGFVAVSEIKQKAILGGRSAALRRVGASQLSVSAL